MLVNFAIRVALQLERGRFTARGSAVYNAVVLDEEM